MFNKRHTRQRLVIVQPHRLRRRDRPKSVAPSVVRTIIAGLTSALVRGLPRRYSDGMVDIVNAPEPPIGRAVVAGYR